MRDHRAGDFTLASFISGVLRETPERHVHQIPELPSVHFTDTLIVNIEVQAPVQIETEGTCQIALEIGGTDPKNSLLLLLRKQPRPLDLSLGTGVSR